MSRGEVDSNGLRTKFSNHSYGLGIDINEKFNGLYENCISWGTACRLRKGGRYNAKNKFSIKENSILVKLMDQIGFKWGGRIKGRQKDFMHFSPSGY